ncbi:helix-turn-helix domain-containing protein [Anaerocolumna sedimenticola]|uniref:Helix-turn-helix domain-containing protein n=1 Tax=Anaerocolumna sedimenticola TaxID=2696063 RepID=A0A6P1TKG5_9FIRM|nr:helix-turn-helix domain-containing protein [Anaerocolumna sedimenticola]QHQ60619.1 helix-turn-helix domain-containing protein [Anaerocolumna sedimenticola]
MPQFDRHKKRTVYIEFVAAEDFNNLPYPERFTLVFVTSGSIKGLLNECPITISAPGVLCLAKDDTIQVVQKYNVSAQSFSFHPDFLSFVTISETRDFISTNLKIQTVLSLFQRDDTHNGVPLVTERAYPQLLEWFFVLGTEVYAQSDTLWVCRIKRYLIQISGLLEDLNRQNGQSPVDRVLAYIHTNYSDKISLKDLTNCAHLNRVSLNKMFQERCGCTAMGYLLSHRLKVAGDLLTHTNMSLNEIARSAGFEYDTYFIKQFTAKRGISPTAYRKTSRKFATAL